LSNSPGSGEMEACDVLAPVWGIMLCRPWTSSTAMPSPASAGPACPGSWEER
jgi:hypothetical protein